MPLYEYHCGGCGESVELLVRNGEAPACPQCGSPRLEKQLSVPAAHTSGGKSSMLPMCDVPMSGGCGAPGCGPGGCGM